MTYKIQNREILLILGFSKTTTKLLQEDKTADFKPAKVNLAFM